MLTIELYDLFMDFHQEMIDATLSFGESCQVTIKQIDDEVTHLTGTRENLIEFMSDFHGGQSIDIDEMNDMIDEQAVRYQPVQ